VQNICIHPFVLRPGQDSVSSLTGFGRVMIRNKSESEDLTKQSLINRLNVPWIKSGLKIMYCIFDTHVSSSKLEAGVFDTNGVVAAEDEVLEKVETSGI